MKRNIILANLAESKKGFDEYVRGVRSDYEAYSNKQNKMDYKSVGETMLEIWNAWCEDRANDLDMILDLNKKEDFNIFLFEFKDLIYEKKDIEVFKQRYVGINYPCSLSNDEKATYTFITEDDLVKMVRSNLDSIIEYALAFPTSYPVWFYQSVVWPILSNEEIVISFDLG